MCTLCCVCCLVRSVVCWVVVQSEGGVEWCCAVCDVACVVWCGVCVSIACCAGPHRATPRHTKPRHAAPHHAPQRHAKQYHTTHNATHTHMFAALCLIAHVSRAVTSCAYFFHNLSGSTNKTPRGVLLCHHACLCLL